MADKTDKKAPAPDKEPKKKGGKLKLIILLAVAVAVLAAGGFAAWKFLLQAAPSGDGSANQTNQTEGGVARDEVAAKAQLVTMDSFVVNLSDPMGRRYLKVTMEVEVADAAAAAELTAAMPKVKDTLLLLLSSKAFADISSLDSKIELKNQIVDRLNLIIGRGKVRNVYFTEFVVQ